MTKIKTIQDIIEEKYKDPKHILLTPNQAITIFKEYLKQFDTKKMTIPEWQLLQETINYLEE